MEQIQNGKLNIIAIENVIAIRAYNVENVIKMIKNCIYLRMKEIIWMKNNKKNYIYI